MFLCSCVQGDNSSLVLELEAEDFSRKEVWQLSDAKGVWEEGQVHVKADVLFFINVPYQVITPQAVVPQPCVLQRRKGRQMVITSCILSEALVAMVTVPSLIITEETL